MLMSVERDVGAWDHRLAYKFVRSESHGLIVKNYIQHPVQPVQYSSVPESRPKGSRLGGRLMDSKLT